MYQVTLKRAASDTVSVRGPQLRKTRWAVRVGEPGRWYTIPKDNVAFIEETGPRGKK